MSLAALRYTQYAGSFSALAVLPSEETFESSEAAPYYFTAPGPRQLQQMLDRSNRYFLETSRHETLQTELERLLMRAPSFGLFMTARTAFEGDVCASLSLALCLRFDIELGREPALRTCLQEAVTNALVHGNLNLHLKDESADSFRAFMDSIDRRMEDPFFQSRRIGVLAWRKPDHITISVTDQGEGFTSRSLDNPKESKFCGRGLMLVRSLAERVWIEDDLKTLSMSFAV